jgi:radical SAM superfamily enzyme YgiQ (UPF0313 family)
MKFLLLNIAPGIIIPSKTQIVNVVSAFYPPLGLLYVGRVLKDEGHEVKIIDFTAERNPKETLERSLPHTDAIGMTIYTQAHKEAESIAENIKTMDKDIPIIIGGPHSTFYPDQTLVDIDHADICVEGEGEHTIKQLIPALQGKQSFHEIPGIRFRENDGIKKGKQPQVITNLDTIAFPDRELVKHYDYGKIHNTNFYKPRFTSMITSRGCPFRCRFCTRHVSSMKKFRKRSIDNVVKELQEINEEYNSVMIADDNFLADVKRAHQILDHIINNGLDLELYIQSARVDTAEKKLFEKMKQAGVKHVYFGIESGNQDVLDFYNKQITLEQIRHAIALSNKMGFFTRGTFILGAPIETKAYLENTIKFATSLPLDVAIFYPLVYQRGSDLWNEAYQQGKITDDDAYSVTADSRRGLGNFTSEELQEYCKMAFRKFHLRPLYFLQQIIKAIRRKDFNLLRIGMNYF